MNFKTSDTKILIYETSMGKRIINHPELISDDFYEVVKETLRLMLYRFGFEKVELGNVAYLEILQGARYYDFPARWYEFTSNMLPVLSYMPSMRDIYHSPGYLEITRYTTVIVADTIATGTTMENALRTLHHYGFNGNVIIFSVAATREGVDRIVKSQSPTYVVINSQLLHLAEDDWSMLRHTSDKSCCIGDFTDRFQDIPKYMNWLRSA